MKTIEQEGVVEKKPSVPSSSRGSSSMDADFFDDFQSGFSMYKGGNQTSESKSMNWGSFDSGTKDRSGGGSKGWTDQEPRRASSPQRRSSPVRNASSRQSREPTSSASGDEAQKKFGSAKAISSDQFFQDANSNDVSTKNACLKPIFYTDIFVCSGKESQICSDLKVPRAFPLQTILTTASSRHEEAAAAAAVEATSRRCSRQIWTT
jgi:hypothetical protein